MKKHIFYLMVPAAILFNGCKDDPEPVPAYLDLQPFTVEALGGASWQKITDGWLYVNGEFLGAYTLPTTIPILAEGESEIILFPGVKENGIIATPNIYPFMTRYEAIQTLTPGENTTVNPVTEYDSGAMFPFNGRGDFDGSSTLQFENRDGDAGTGYFLSSDDAFAGECLRMEVDTAHWLMEIASEKTALPTSGERQVWLELHYKNDVPFSLYLLGSIGSSGEQAQAVYLFNDSDSWNKIYINLTEFLIASLQDDYRLFFQAGLPRDASNNFTQDKGTVLLDNIRLVHF